ncbi:MAG: creatininase family protein, partial [Candidatus Bathyarchaeia archaeon]
KKSVEDTDFLVAPMVNYGLERSTRGFAGSISLGFETLKQLVKDILLELTNQGFKKIVLFSFHASSTHLVALKEAAFDFVQKNRKAKVYLVSSADLFGHELLKILETPPQHACELETSLMLYLKPEAVQMNKAVEEYPSGTPFLVYPSGREWMRTGVIGDPRKASAEKGEKLLKLMTQKFREILNNIQKESTSPE